jgi:integrase
MRHLNFALKNLCQRLPQGSHATRAARHRDLQLIATQLWDMGYKVKSASSLKPKHVTALVRRWQEEDLSTGTIKNRMGHMRWWADAVNKTSVIPSNEALGIGLRRASGENRAQKLDMERLAMVDCPYIRFSLRLQAAFGLRREEAMKFRPFLADKGEYIVLKPSWTKGGRYREIPITTARQRSLLNEVSHFAKGDSLIPNDKTYVAHLKAYESRTLKAGLRNNHGLRHNYAQWRYRCLTGWICPAVGGKSPANMTPDEVTIDKFARMTISRELGHARLEITNIYLGGRRI